MSDFTCSSSAARLARAPSSWFQACEIACSTWRRALSTLIRFTLSCSAAWRISDEGSPPEKIGMLTLAVMLPPVSVSSAFSDDAVRPDEGPVDGPVRPEPPERPEMPSCSPT